jgi:hypothetical protein
MPIGRKGEKEGGREKERRDFVNYIEKIEFES